MATKAVQTFQYGEMAEQKKMKARWWLEKDEVMHEHVIPVINQIREQQSFRRAQNLRFAQMYENMQIIALQPGKFSSVQNPGGYIGNLLSYNVVKACIDTAASKIAKQKTRPMFLTDDEDWVLQRRAEQLTKYFEGVFDTIGYGQGDHRTLYGLGRRNFVDSGIFGTGVTKFIKDTQLRTVKAERVISEEIVVDDSDGMYEMPRQMHQEKAASREVLCDLFKSKADKIMKANSLIDDDGRSSSDKIKVFESWHLPSGVDAKDGKWCISVDGATLQVDEWNKDYFPFLFQRWNSRVLGFFGQGIAEELFPIQLEINKLLRSIAISQHLCSTPQVWLEMANATNPQKISNAYGSKNYYLGQPPIFLVPQAMSAEVYQHLETLYNKAFQITGTSQMSATSQKPAGIDSGRALREWSDIESDRFQLVGQRYQDFYIEAAYLCADLMNDLAEDGGKMPAVRVTTPEGSREINWKDVKIAKEKLQIRAYPTDLLPSTPSGKLQTAQELTQAGYFDKEESLALLDFPDVKAATSLKTAPRDVLKKMLERIITDGEYETPEPEMGLQMGATLSQAYYLREKARGCPPERLELLLRFMDDCKTMLDTAAQDQMAKQASAVQAGMAADPAAAGMAQAPMSPGADPLAAITGGMPPQAQPELPPTSDLLPTG